MKEEKDDDFGAASPQKGGAGDEADLQPAIQPRQNENPQNVALPPTSHIPPPARNNFYRPWKSPKKVLMQKSQKFCTDCKYVNI